MIPTMVSQEVCESPKPDVKKDLLVDPVSSSKYKEVAKPSEQRTQSPIRRKRKIKFNKIVHNRRIPHLNDLLASQIEATWIRPEEYLEIRARCIATVKIIMRGQLTLADIESEEHCPRGLEGKTKAGSSLRREHKLDSIAAVVEEQSLQWNEDVDDDEAIMEVYSVFAIPCAENAHQMGLGDQQAAKECHESIPTNKETQPTTCTSTSTPSLRDGTTTMDKLREIFHLRSSRAALLQDVEKNFFEEAAMERRTRQAACTTVSQQRNNVLATQLGEYFTQRKTDEKALPSLASIPSGSSSSTDRSLDEDEGSTDGSTSSDNFTSHLSGIFRDRKHRQALLESIENAYPVQPTIVTTPSTTTTENKVSNVTMISQTLGSRLQDIFGPRKGRAAVLNELSNSSHMRQ
jgi:hypothetical protein